MAGGQAIKFVTLNDATKQRRQLDAGARVAPTPAGSRRTTPRWRSSAPFNSGAAAVADPDHQRGRRADGQPVEHRTSASRAAAPARSPASRTSTTRPASAPTSASCPTTACRPTRWRRRCATRGCKRVGAVHDGEVYGAGVGKLMRASVTRLGHEGRRRPRAIRRSTRRFGAIKGDCIAYTGITANGAVRMFRPASAARRSCSPPTASPSPASPATCPRSVARRMTITVSTLAPDAYGPAGAAIIGSGDPYKLYGYEAMKLILDGLNAAGASKLALLGWLRRASRTARACSAPTRSTPTATRPCAPTASTASAARQLGLEGRDHRRVRQRDLPSRVSVAVSTVRSPSTSRHSPARQLQRHRLAAQQRGGDAPRRRARTRPRPGRRRAARRRPRTPRAARARSASARRIRSQLRRRVARAPRGAASQSTARRLSGSTSDRQSSSSPW